MNRRRSVLIPLAAFGVALALALIGSATTGPAFDELGRLAAVEQCEDVIRQLARQGPRALVSDEARARYASFDGRGTLLALGGAWSKLSLGRLGVLDPLTSARLPWLVVSSLGAAALVLLVMPSYGTVAALLSLALLVVLPRWFHGVAVTSDGALLASVFLIVLAAYTRSFGAAGARRRLCWSVATAALVGLGLSLTLAAGWVLVLMAAHFMIARSDELRRLRHRGRVPGPTALLASVAIAPPVLLATNPALWKTNTVLFVRWVMTPLEPSVAPTMYRGELVTALPVPGGYALTFLLHTLPIAVLAAALLGAVWLTHRALARRFASGTLRPARDPGALSSLLALTVGAAIVGPTLVPDVFTRFPPRTELALPFVSAFAGIGLGAVAAAARPRLGPAVAAGVVGLIALSSLRAPATLSAAFSPWLGGVPGVVQTRLLPAGDGSELASLSRALEAQGPTLTLSAPEVPAAYWTALARSGRLSTTVQPSAPAPGALTLGRGGGAGESVASVDRGGVRLWTLAR